jgi:hypothetical protein
MFANHRSRLCMLAALALGLCGCTFDEDELHGVNKPPEAGVTVDLAPPGVASDGRPDGGGIGVGTPDAPGLDGGRVDGGEDVPSPDNLDGGALDAQAIDVAEDRPLGGLDVSLDASVIDAASVDGGAVDVARSEAGRLDGGRSG